MRIPYLNLIDVPADLPAVTTRSDAEVPPRGVGVDPAAVAHIWDGIEAFYRSGLQPSIQICVRRHGEVILDRAIGHASGNGPADPPESRKVLATPDTPYCIFSASKAVTAMVIHLLDQMHLLHVSDRVTEYIPEFGRHGKHRITIEHVLTHRAGIPNLPPNELNLDNLAHPERFVEILCDAEPTWAPGRRLAYHAATGGFILAEIARRVTGKSIAQLLTQHILRPLGFRWMSYGVKARDVQRVALSYFTGPPLLPPLAALSRRALGIDFADVPALSNDPRYLRAVVPSGNVVATANELSRFFQLLLNEGELAGVRIFAPRPLPRATSAQSYLEFDLTLAVPIRYSMGFMIGGLYFFGPDTSRAFGHLGFINLLGWADPDRQVSAAIMTSGKPFFFPELYFLYEIMRRVGEACPPTKPRSRAAQQPSKRSRRTTEPVRS